LSKNGIFAGRSQYSGGGGLKKEKIRAADAKEVGVGNPAEETCCYPNTFNVTFLKRKVNTKLKKNSYFYETGVHFKNPACHSLFSWYFDYPFL
jgi:hypothetical protein